MKPCFNNIIGISNTLSTCLTWAEPEEPSKSDLYLEELNPQMLVNIADVLEEPLDEMTALLANATRVVINDIMTVISGRLQQPRKTWKGKLGETKFSGTGFGGRKAGIKIGCAPLQGGKLKIDSIGIVWGGTESVDIEVIKDGDDGEVLHTVTIEAVANTHVKVDGLDINLDMYDEYNTVCEYYIVANGQITDHFGKNTKIYCECGATVPPYSINKAYFYPDKKREASKGWTSFAMIEGVLGDGTNFDSKGNRAFGVTVGLSFTCESTNFLCRQLGEFDNTNPVNMSIAFGLRYKAGDMVAERLLLSNKLNRSQIINREMLTQLRADWAKAYAEQINYIGNVIDVESDDCYHCVNPRDNFLVMKTKEILS